MQVYKMHKTYTKNMCILPMDIHKKIVYNRNQDKENGTAKGENEVAKAYRRHQHNTG